MLLFALDLIDAPKYIMKRVLLAVGAVVVQALHSAYIEAHVEDPHSSAGTAFQNPARRMLKTSTALQALPHPRHTTSEPPVLREQGVAEPSRSFRFRFLLWLQQYVV